LFTKGAGTVYILWSDWKLCHSYIRFSNIIMMSEKGSTAKYKKSVGKKKDLE